LVNLTDMMANNRHSNHTKSMNNFVIVKMLDHFDHIMHENKN